MAAAGAGGGGAFILVASGGVTFTGTGEQGTGGAAVFGAFTNDGSFPDGSPDVLTYSDWQYATASDYYLVGGAGGGGSGGDGQVQPQPSVTSVSPSSGPMTGGTSVTIQGSNLSTAYQVMFGSTAAASFTVNPDGSLTAVSPAEPPGTVDVTVTSGGGTSPVVPGDQFTFTSGSSPALVSKAPLQLPGGLAPGSKGGPSTVVVPGGGAAGQTGSQPAGGFQTALDSLFANWAKLEQNLFANPLASLALDSLLATEFGMTSHAHHASV